MDQEVRWLLAEKLLHVRTGLVHPRRDLISRRSVALATFNSTLGALLYVNAPSPRRSGFSGVTRRGGRSVSTPSMSESQDDANWSLGDGEPPRPERMNLVPAVGIPAILKSRAS